VPVENLLTPDTLRRVLWSPPAPDRLEPALLAYGARPWQVDLTAPLLREALAETAATRVAREQAAAEPADASGDTLKTAAAGDAPTDVPRAAGTDVPPDAPDSASAPA